MPIYRESLKVEARILIQANKPINDSTKGAIIVELEQLVNAGQESTIFKYVHGLHIKASLRLHLKER